MVTWFQQAALQAQAAWISDSYTFVNDEADVDNNVYVHSTQTSRHVLCAYHKKINIAANVSPTFHMVNLHWNLVKKTPVRVFFDFQIATHITSAMAQMHANVNIATRHGQPNSLTSLLIEGHESVMVDVQTQEGGGGGCETSKKHVKISQIDQWPFQNFTKLNWRCLPYLFHYIYTYTYI